MNLGTSCFFSATMASTAFNNVKKKISSRSRVLLFIFAIMFSFSFHQLYILSFLINNE